MSILQYLIWILILMIMCKTVYIFDTSNTTWLTNFDSSFKSYRVPTKIINVIGGNENGTAPWVSVPVMKPTDTNSPFYNIGTSGTPMSQPASSSHHTSTSLIVGPIVGGIAAIIVGLGLVWWIKRRAKRRRESQFPPALPLAATKNYKYDAHDVGSMRSPVPAYDYDPDNRGLVQLDSGGKLPFQHCILCPISHKHGLKIDITFRGDFSIYIPCRGRLNGCKTGQKAQCTDTCRAARYVARAYYSITVLSLFSADAHSDLVSLLFKWYQVFVSICYWSFGSILLSTC